MYRIFCESYQNYINSFEDDNSRLKLAKPLELIVDLDIYENERKQCSDICNKLCDIIYYMKQNIKHYPRFKAFL